MNKRHAKAYILRVLAAEARHHISNGSDWLEHPLDSDGIATDPDGSFSEADQRRLVAALNEIADELETRGNRLRGSPPP
jgi:hypothetical protein